jgi:hypothetical protein
MRHAYKLTKDAHKSYKIGVDEIEGLKAEMYSVIKPIQVAIKDQTYWNDCEFKDSGYKSRDGFIPHSHNGGGPQLRIVVPKSEESSFGFVGFGDCDECGNETEYPEGDHQCGYNGVECGNETEGHLDASLRVWFKFEGIDTETGTLNFYLVVAGGNGDAPYFRTNYEEIYFESEFSCKSVKGLKKAASKHIKAVLKLIEGA